LSMYGICFCINTADRTLLTRWTSAFRKEGWAVLCQEVPLRGCHSAGSAELDLVEVGPGGCRTPEDLGALIRMRKPFATLAFADRKNVSDLQIVRYLESGADDFVFSNLDERVVVAKLKAYLRRQEPAMDAAQARLSTGSGDVVVDLQKRTVRIKCLAGGPSEIFDLTQKELEILALLVGCEKRPVARGVILERLWGEEAGEVYPNCLSKHIEMLRKKLGPYGKRIRTVYGSGYMFT